MIPAATTTGTANYTSPAVQVQMQDQLSIHYTVGSSGATSTMVCEVQNGDTDAWHALDFGTPLDVSTQTDNLIVINAAPFTQIRLRVVGSGSGTSLVLTAWITSKSVGA